MSKTSGRLVLTLILTLDPPISYVRCPRMRTGGTPQRCLLLQCHLKSATPWLVVNQPRRPGLSARSPGQLEHAAFRPSGQNVAGLPLPNPRARLDGPSRGAAPLNLPGRDCTARTSTSLVREAAHRFEGEKQVEQRPAKLATYQPVSADTLHHRPAALSLVTGDDPCPTVVLRPGGHRQEDDAHPGPVPRPEGAQASSSRSYFIAYTAEEEIIPGPGWISA